jgi:hypothetical protein
VTYNYKNFGGCSSHTFWRGFLSYILEVFFFSYLFKVAITVERVSSKTTRGSHLARDYTHLFALINKGCSSLEEHRVVTWAGGVVVSTVRKETVCRNMQRVSRL